MTVQSLLAESPQLVLSDGKEKLCDTRNVYRHRLNFFSRCDVIAAVKQRMSAAADGSGT